MSTKIYYRAGKPDKDVDPTGGKVGHIQAIEEYIAKDETRVAFEKQLTEDESFRKMIGFTKHPVEEYLHEWKERAKTGGQFVQPADHVNEKGVHDGLMCTNLYELGTLVSLDDDGKCTIKTIEGKNQKFDKKTETCVYDPSHDEDTIPDDVVAVQGFGEASMLKCMRRRISEKFNIYTYVGDVVLVLNPYMYLPAMVDISEPPAQKMFKLGSDPSVYATAHFAYYGLRDPDNYNPESNTSGNQSCPVSGESGAGKTVACGFIMKYLAKLSDWRLAELGKKKDPDQKDITSLVAGVSPFLEGFGNAKTTMNDNSSRFGKFTKILFQDGMIVGAEMICYLLEKARLVDQGEHERNYHIFYGLVKGATAEEQSKYKLAKVEDYDMLMHGHTPIIEHETKADGSNMYDYNRMNNALAKDPDDTGFRAAFKNAQVDEAQQAIIWDAIAGMLKLSQLRFESCKNDKGEGASKVSNVDIAKQIEALWGIEGLSEKIVLFKLTCGSSILMKPMSPSGSNDNRNALLKAYYGHIFDWLFDGVANVVLKPEGPDDGFCGLLDIFGFEVFKKNSIEQLCINFANEKLQKLFNDHVFNTEKETYKSQGISDDCIPPYKDNTPCCNLVSRSNKGFMGVLPHIDDVKPKKTPEETAKQDEKYCADLIKQWGRKAGVNKKCKSKKEKMASECFYAKKARGSKYFIIRHFAGDVKYYVEGWVTKNVDKLPEQLEEMMLASKVPFVKHVFTSGGGKKGAKTISKQFLSSLAQLAKTLEATNPHYVKCVKPNDIHFRPVDGKASFNAWKTYRQLKFAGVMEVCKIKLQGYSFRCDYSKFWNKRCVPNKYHVFADLDASIDPQEGCEALCKLIMPPPQVSKIDGKERPTWVSGKSWLFGKDYLQDKFTKWHQSKVVTIVQKVVRYYTFQPTLQRAIYASGLIIKRWKRKLKLRLISEACKVVQKVYTAFSAYVRWQSTGYRLGRIELVKGAAEKIQHGWRNYNAYLNLAKTWRDIVHLKSKVALDAIASEEVQKVRLKLAANIMLQKIKQKLIRLRRAIRVQKFVRGTFPRNEFVALKKQAEIEKNASFVAESVYSMTGEVSFLAKYYRAIVKIQTLARGYVKRTTYLRKRPIRSAAHAFARMVVRRNKFLLKRKAQIDVAKWYRFHIMRRYYRKQFEVYDRIGLFIRTRLRKVMLRKFVSVMEAACLAGDLVLVKRLLGADLETGDDNGTTRGRFYRLAGLKIEHIQYQGQLVETFPLVNIREPMMMCSPVHCAVKSGNRALVRYLLRQGAEIEVQDAKLETPLHSSCKCGDSTLEMSKLILSSCSEPVEDETTWMLSLECMNRQEQTVLDVAMSADDSMDTVSWLVEQQAKSTTNVEDNMERVAEQQRLWDAKEREAEAILRREEEEKYNQDPSYVFLTMDPKAGQHDPMVRKMKKMKSQKTTNNFSKVYMAVLVLQVAFRKRLKKRAEERSQARDERLARVALVKARVESADMKRRMREAKIKSFRLRKFAAEKKRKEIEDKFKDTTVQKASGFTERLRQRSAMRSQRRRDMAKQMALKAANDVKRRGLQGNTLHEDLENLLNESVEPPELVDSPPQAPSIPSKNEEPPAMTTSVDPPGLVEKRSSSSDTKKQQASLSLGEIHRKMRDAVVESNRKEETELLRRTHLANIEMENEARRLADEIEALKRARHAATKSKMRRAIAADVRSTQWFYRDLDGTVHGPFPAETMSEWTKAGFFHESLACSANSNGPFVSIGRMFPMMDRAFLVAPRL